MVYFGSAGPNTTISLSGIAASIRTSQLTPVLLGEIGVGFELDRSPLMAYLPSALT